MSYRAFKKLLGETSLERKCRWLLGTGVLLLMTGSFYFYARQTEVLAYEQLKTSGRALLSPILARQHVNEETGQAIDAFQAEQEQHSADQFKNYSYRIIRIPLTNALQSAPVADDMMTIS